MPSQYNSAKVCRSWRRLRKSSFRLLIRLLRSSRSSMGSGALIAHPPCAGLSEDHRRPTACSQVHNPSPRLQERTGNNIDASGPQRQDPWPQGGLASLRNDFECRTLARYADELLQAAHARRHRLAGVGIVLPRRPGHLPDIDIAMPVDAEAVRCGELTDGQPGFLIDPADYLALAREDAETRPEIGELGVDRLMRPQLADVADAVRAALHVEAAGAVQIVPLRLVSAVAVEDLHPMVLPVGDIDPAVGIADDIVRDVEFARTGAAFAPGKQQLAVRREFVDAGVGVAVRDIDVEVRRQRGVGAAVERLAAHKGGRSAGDTDL